MQPDEDVDINPDLGDEAIAMGVYASLHLLVDEISEFEYEYGGGHVIGKLRRSIGPIPRHTRVLLLNQNDKVNVSLVLETGEIDEETDEPILTFKKVYSFRIAIPDPIIIEDKRRM